jgi:hypothetical protein
MHELPRDLRIGVFQGDHLVREQVIREARRVSVGSAPRNDIRLAGEGLPRRFPLFERTRRGSWFRFTAAMQGLVCFEDEHAELTLDELRDQSRLWHGRYSLHLPEHVHGKVMFGQVSIVFQLVPTREAQAAPPGRWHASLLAGSAAAAVLVCGLVLPSLIEREPSTFHAPPARAPAPRLDEPAAAAPSTPLLLGDPVMLFAALARGDAAAPVGDRAPPAGSGQLRAAAPLPRPNIGAVESRSREAERRIPARAPARAWVADGLLTADVIRAEIERRKGAILSAYERALRHRPDLEGLIEVRFTVDGEGRVGEVAIVRDTLGDPEVAARIVTLLPSWRFPAPAAGPVTWAYPFTFRPAHALP